MIGVGHDLASFAHKGLPRLGELYFSIRPAEELCSDLILELTDLLAQWRLSHVQSFGGPSKVQFFSDRDDIAKMSKFHFYRYL